MAKTLVRSHTAKQSVIKQWNNERSARWENPGDGSSVLEVQVTHNPTVFKNVPAAKNYLTPPYHWHWYQEEYFQIISGKFFFNYEGNVKTYTAADGKVTIPPKIRHTFWPDPDSAEPAEVHITTQEEGGKGLTEQFFRNIYGYLEDCGSQGVEPSLPQLLLFLDSSETSLALPVPGFIGRWLSWGMGVVIGRWYGGYVLGLKTSYSEYYEERKDT